MWVSHTRVHHVSGLYSLGKKEPKTARSHHPAPTLRSGVPSLRPCSREDRAHGPSMGRSACRASCPSPPSARPLLGLLKSQSAVAELTRA